MVNSVRAFSSNQNGEMGISAPDRVRAFNALKDIRSVESRKNLIHNVKFLCGDRQNRVEILELLKEKPEKQRVGYCWYAAGNIQNIRTLSDQEFLAAVKTLPEDTKARLSNEEDFFPSDAFGNPPPKNEFEALLDCLEHASSLEQAIDLMESVEGLIPSVEGHPTDWRTRIQLMCFLREQGGFDSEYQALLPYIRDVLVSQGKLGEELVRGVKAAWERARYEHQKGKFVSIDPRVLDLTDALPNLQQRQRMLRSFSLVGPRERGTFGNQVRQLLLPGMTFDQMMQEVEGLRVPHYQKQ